MLCDEPNVGYSQIAGDGMCDRLISNRVYLFVKIVLVIALVIPSARLYAQPVSAEIVKLTTRGDVTQQYLLIKQSDQPKVAAVLFTGGDDALKFSGTFPNIRWEPAGASYVVRARGYFRDVETAVAIVDAASDRWSIGQDHTFRSSNAHVEDVRLVVSDLRRRFPKAKLYFVGTSSGTVSAARVGRQLASEINGVVLSSAIFVGRMSLTKSDVDDYPVPLLFVHHANDPCQWTPYSAVKAYAERHPFIEVTGGESAKDNGCGPMGPHGFLGLEREVALEIKNWIHGRPYKKQLP